MKNALLMCIYKKIQVCSSLPTDSTPASFWYIKAQMQLKSDYVLEILSSTLNWDLNLHGMPTL